MSLTYSCPRWTLAPFLPVTFSFAVFQYLLPHSPPSCVMTPLPSSFFRILCGQSCDCNSLLHLGRDTGGGGGFTWEEDRETSKLLAPGFPMPSAQGHVSFQKSKAC